MIRTFVLALSLGTALAAAPGRIPLSGDWRLQSSAQVQAAGEVLSLPGAAVEGWHRAQVPCTVLGALAAEGLPRDPYVGKNLAAISPEPFKAPWWYRTEFTGGKAAPGQITRLVFEGLNYRADIWLNGTRIAGREGTFGVWRVFDLDITRRVREGANALAVEVFPPGEQDFAMGFADWNPAPPDGNMGLFRPVSLRRSGGVSLEDPFVRSRVDLRTLKAADLVLEAGLVNHGDRPVSGTLRGALGAARFQVPYALGPGERRTLHLTRREVPALHLRNPRLWWPVNLGRPELYDLDLSLRDAAGSETDARRITFGVREVGDYRNPQGHRGYTVNGRRILIRGGGWADDLFLREDARNLEDQMAYVRHMNLNTIRMEGFWGSSRTVYDLADRYGILVLPGFSCQWEWDHYKGHPADTEEYGAAKLPADIELQAAYLRDQVRELRNHPCILAWVVGSDKLPWPEAEARYREDLARLDPGRPYLASCKGLQSTLSGNSAVKMLGPYNYVTPIYWFQDRSFGGAYGFNTETGPGPVIPPVASLRRMFPPERLWPRNDVWNYHCALHGYGNLDVFMDAVNRRYGEAPSLETFAFKAQAANYEALRAMYEAFGANKPESTGIIQWMLNSAWPKLYWQLYDTYLMPGGAFFGARKGCAPLGAVYDYARHNLHLVNDTPEDFRGTLRIILLDADSRVLLTRRVEAACAALAATWVADVPRLGEGSPVYFLDLALEDAGGRERARNFYWLSPRADEPDPATFDKDAILNKDCADFKALDALPGADVGVESVFSGDGCAVTLTNASSHVAFFLELQIRNGGEVLLPVLWDDNYISLLPGERRTLHARFRDPGGKADVVLNSWNGVCGKGESFRSIGQALDATRCADATKQRRGLL